MTVMHWAVHAMILPPLPATCEEILQYVKWAEQAGVTQIDALARITSVAAALLGLDCGQLGIGRDADVCIFDPNQYWKVEANALVSQGKNTPFNGLELRGQVKQTLLHGHTVYQKFTPA